MAIPHLLKKNSKNRETNKLQLILKYSGESFMLFRSTGWLALSIFFLTFLTTTPTSIAKTQTPTKSEKKWAKVDGFRSAKFGMREKDVYRAINKDFKIKKSEVKRTTNNMELTTVFEIDVPKLLHVGGSAKVAYVFGYKSKKLVQVNVIWSQKVKDQKSTQGVVNAANILRNHLIKKRYQKDGYAANTKLNNATTVVFRGKDKNNRMALLVLNVPPEPKDKNAKSPTRSITLSLNYILEIDNPDVLTINEDDF